MSASKESSLMRELGRMDHTVTLLVVLLLCLGLTMVLSAGSVIPGLSDKYYYFKRQLIFVGAGGVLCAFAAYLPRRILYNLPYPMLAFALILLVVTLLFGREINGATRWLSLGFLSIQPLELAKLLMDIGCDPTKQLPIGCDPVKHHDSGWDSLVCLAYSTIVWERHPADPQVTDLFLSCGCRTNLDGCKMIADAHRLSFDQILKEHAEWKKSLS